MPKRPWVHVSPFKLPTRFKIFQEILEDPKNPQKITQFPPLEFSIMPVFKVVLTHQYNDTFSILHVQLRRGLDSHQYQYYYSSTLENVWDTKNFYQKNSLIKFSMAQFGSQVNQKLIENFTSSTDKIDSRSLP